MNPCFKCTERQMSCHVKCEEYKQFRDMKDKQLKEDHANRNSWPTYRAYHQNMFTQKKR